jgi:hypothetical protein
MKQHINKSILGCEEVIKFCDAIIPALPSDNPKNRLYLKYVGMNMQVHKQKSCILPIHRLATLSVFAYCRHTCRL